MSSSEPALQPLPHALSIGRLLLLRAAYRVNLAAPSPTHATAVSDAVIAAAANCVAKVRSERSFSFSDCAPGAYLPESRQTNSVDAAKAAMGVMLKYRPTRQVLFDAMVKLPHAQMMLSALGVVEGTQGSHWDPHEAATLAPVSLNALSVLVCNAAQRAMSTPRPSDLRAEIDAVLLAARASPVNREFTFGLLTHLCRSMPAESSSRVFCEGLLRLILLRPGADTCVQPPWVTAQSSPSSASAMRFCRAVEESAENAALSDDVFKALEALCSTLRGSPVNQWKSAAVPILTHPRHIKAVMTTFLRVAPARVQQANESLRTALIEMSGLVDFPQAHPVTWSADKVAVWSKEFSLVFARVRSSFESTQRLVITGLAGHAPLTSTRLVVLSHLAHQIRLADPHDPLTESLRNLVWPVRPGEDDDDGDDEDVQPSQVVAEDSVVSKLAFDDRLATPDDDGGVTAAAAFMLIDAVCLVAANACRVADGEQDDAPECVLWRRAALELLCGVFRKYAALTGAARDLVLEHWMVRVEAFAEAVEGFPSRHVSRLVRVIVGTLLLREGGGQLAQVQQLASTLPRTARRLRALCRKSEKHFDGPTRLKIAAAMGR